MGSIHFRASYWPGPGCTHFSSVQAYFLLPPFHKCGSVINIFLPLPSRPSHSVSVSASRELNLHVKKSHTFHPFQALFWWITLECYNFLGDNITIRNIDVGLAVTKRFLFPFPYFYKTGFSAFISINTKHRNRFGVEPHFILASSKNHPCINEVIEKNKTPSI